jgi:hypothetical protein
MALIGGYAKEPPTIVEKRSTVPYAVAGHQGSIFFVAVDLTGVTDDVSYQVLKDTPRKLYSGKSVCVVHLWDKAENAARSPLMNER